MRVSLSTYAPQENLEPTEGVAGAGVPLVTTGVCR
jgi:hypothetical protein